jgi:hypothetical protein
MFLGCEMTFLFCSTSEDNITVFTLMFDNRLWLLFLKVFFAYEMAKFILVRLKSNLTVVTLVFNNGFRLWVLLLKMSFTFDMCIVDTLILTL